MRGWVQHHRAVLVPDLPPGVDSLYRDLRDPTRPYVYLQHMVEIVRRTEAAQLCGRRRLRSPFVLRNGLVPGHFTLDTTAAMHLLMDRAAIARFKVTQIIQKSRQNWAVPLLMSTAIISSKRPKNMFNDACFLSSVATASQSQEHLLWRWDVPPVVFPDISTVVALLCCPVQNGRLAVTK